jgi:hypothetical protein
MELQGEKYYIKYEPSQGTLELEGTLRLYGASGYFSLEGFQQHLSGAHAEATPSASPSYECLKDILDELVTLKPSSIVLHLQKLQNLNSSVINLLSKFALSIYTETTSQLTIYAKQELPWQIKMLKNIQKLNPDIILELN